MTGGLTFEQVGCVRRERLLFEGLSFALSGGDAVLVTGPNGAGKSSLLRVAAGLLPAAGGRVIREGRVALLAEMAALDGERPLARTLDFWARMDGGGMANVAAALDDVGLTDLADVPVRVLSTGQRRRAGLARVLASGADIWLLDEPANGLDTWAVARLEALIARHRTRGGIAVVATHGAVALPGAMCVLLGK